MVERIRSLLAQFTGDEGTVRELVARDASFDALCHEHRKVIEMLGNFEVHVKLLKQRRALLEEKLLTPHRRPAAAVVHPAKAASVMRCLKGVLAKSIEEDRRFDAIDAAMDKATLVHFREQVGSPARV
jgi:hypothetical protein